MVIDWAGRKQRARSFLLTPPKGKRAWSTLTYEYDKAPDPYLTNTESDEHPIGLALDPTLYTDKAA